MEAVVIITVLVLLQYTYFGVQVGGIRVKTGTKAPEQAGPPEFMRMNRVHLNTLEQLPVFLPALWMYGYYVNPLWAAAIGVVFLIGRFLEWKLAGELLILVEHNFVGETLHCLTPCLDIEQLHRDIVNFLLRFLA